MIPSKERAQKNSMEFESYAIYKDVDDVKRALWITIDLKGKE
jgi:hypothetical protein